MTEERETKIIRVAEETHTALTNLSTTHGYKMGIIIGLLVDECKKYGMLEADWIDKLRDQLRVEMVEGLEEDKKVRQAITIMQAKAMIQAKMKILQTYLNDMPIEDRRKFTTAMLGMKSDPNNPTLYLEGITDYQLFKVNGDRQFLKTQPDGSPQLKGVDEADVIPCSMGVHVRFAWCNCALWRSCALRKKEGEEKLSDPRFKATLR